MFVAPQDRSHGGGKLGVVGNGAPESRPPGNFLSRQAVGSRFGQNGMDRLPQRSRSRRTHRRSWLRCGGRLFAIGLQALDLRAQIGKLGDDAGVMAQLLKRHLPELRDRQLGVLWCLHRIRCG